MNEMSARRANMVNSQVLTNRVTDDKVVEALLAVPRENFVPKAMAGVAYVDDNLEVAPGRYLLSPMVFARMVQAVDVAPDDLVLDIAPATGYSSAVLAQMSGTVVAIDSDENLVEQANGTLNDMGIENAAAVAGEMGQGLAEQGPYDVIFVNGAVIATDDALTAQLSDGGRLVTIEGDGLVCSVVLYERSGEILARRVLFDAAAHLLPGCEAENGFSF